MEDNERARFAVLFQEKLQAHARKEFADFLRQRWRFRGASLCPFSIRQPKSRLNKSELAKSFGLRGNSRKAPAFAIRFFCVLFGLGLPRPDAVLVF